MILSELMFTFQHQMFDIVHFDCGITRIRLSQRVNVTSGMVLAYKC